MDQDQDPDVHFPTEAITHHLPHPPTVIIWSAGNNDIIPTV